MSDNIKKVDDELNKFIEINKQFFERLWYRRHSRGGINRRLAPPKEECLRWVVEDYMERKKMKYK